MLPGLQTGKAGAHLSVPRETLMSDTTSRRDFLKISALGLGAMGAMPAASAAAADKAVETAAPRSEISVRVTAGDRRFAADQPVQWQKGAHAASPNTVRLDPSQRFQEILGFGGAFTDGACYMFNQLTAPAREQLFHELFHPSEMGLNVCRTCIGASDCSTVAYSYDDGEEDLELKRFSIARDREYILPILRQSRQVNPDLFLFASPWSPPGWMKWNRSMLGGSMNRKYLGSYARYIVKFLQAYAAEGVPIQAVTSQNEVDTDQNGAMPACLWAQEAEIDFVGDYLGPLLESSSLSASTKIWLLDHNYSLWGRAVCELEDPDVRRYANAIAWHCYSGTPEMIGKAHAEHPDAEMHFTEGGGNLDEPHYLDNWAKWSAVLSGALRNWCRSLTVWNLALDQNGKPNIGPYPCAGLVVIDSQSKELTRIGLYWALAHYARAIKRGAHRFDSQSHVPDLEHVALENPDGQKVLILTNPGPARSVQLLSGEWAAAVPLREDSVATLLWS
jgi:glucosylceramidase